MAKTSFQVGRWDLSSRWSNRFSNVWDDASFQGVLIPRKGRIEQEVSSFRGRCSKFFSYWIWIMDMPGHLFSHFVYFEYFIIKKNLCLLLHVDTLLTTSASVNISMKRNWNSILKSWFRVVGRFPIHSSTWHTAGAHKCLLNWNSFCNSQDSLPCPSDWGLPTFPVLTYSTQHSSDWTRNIQLISS